MGFVPEGLSGANITQDTARLAIRDPNLATYIFWCLYSVSMQTWMARHVKGVAVQGINLGDVKQIPIPIPNEDSLAKMHAMHQRFGMLRSRNSKHALASANLFNSLVQRAFRGEL